MESKGLFVSFEGLDGSGKAQPIDTIIPTPLGPRKLGDIKIGDYVYDRFGLPTKVLGVYPQGLKDNYRITLADGRITYCNNEHLWSCYTSKGHLKTFTVQEMIEHGFKKPDTLGHTKNGYIYRYKIPNNKAIEMPMQEYTIDPYIIGLFLGDGCCLERQLTISSENDEIPNYIASATNTVAIRNSDYNYNWTFNLSKEQQYYKNYQLVIKLQTKVFFKDFLNELCVSTANKKIPDIYKYGSIQQRLALLQGLFDTDGSITQQGKVSFSNTNLGLVKDVQQILRTLGYNSTIHIDYRPDKYTNQEHSCYNLNVRIPHTEKYKLFKLSRKYQRAIDMQSKTAKTNYESIYITNIEKLNEQKEMVCIYVDNAEHLYLTNDYIVTHNTSCMNTVAEKLRAQGYNVVTTREPGGTPIAEKIRDIILHDDIAPETEALLFAAARTEHTYKKIRPLVNDGVIVLSDRYLGSSIAYQGYARKLGINNICAINDFGIEGYRPDIQLFIDVVPEECFKRMGDRAKDRMESQPMEFYKNIYKCFKEHPAQYQVTIDGMQAPEKVAEDALNTILETIQKNKEGNTFEKK